MKIIYKSSEQSPLLGMLGIENCLIKEISCDEDSRFTMKKEHHHAGFEIHVITRGCQSYDFSGSVKHVEAGSFIVISPYTKHRTEMHLAGTEKFSMTFQINGQSPFSLMNRNFEIKIAETDNRLFEVFAQLSEEAKNRCIYCGELSDALAVEVLVRIMRGVGVEIQKTNQNDDEEDVRIQMAKQYINDNIELNLRVSDVASYCYMGEKQLTRLFKIYIDETPGAYIHRKKCSKIEKLLVENISLKEISEKMHFASEYNFNSFFRKYAGMPPGEYRRMIKKRK